MSVSCFRRCDCRLCHNQDLTLVLSLTPSPPANAFVSESELNIKQPVFPLDVYLCKSCCHVQILDVVDPNLLFENYVYVSGTSPILVRHFENYANNYLCHYKPRHGSLVIDIGSNDGTLLHFFKNAGMKVLGIDPAHEIAARANAEGIETWPEFFSPELARRIKNQRGTATLVTANNVFAHADDLNGIVEGVRVLLAADGVFQFEFSYLADVYEKTLFDTIYHEHLAYHSVKPLVRFFTENDMTLIEAKRTDPHGGSLHCTAQLAGGPWPLDSSVGEMIDREEQIGIDNADTLLKFSQDIDELRDKLTASLAKIKADGKTIAGFGAAAKATTLMYHFGIGPEVIDFIVDDSPLKQGLYSPGMHIPILSSTEIYRRRPDYLLILAWNFADSIIAKHKNFQTSGGRFILPLPEVKII